MKALKSYLINLYLTLREKNISFSHISVSLCYSCYAEYTANLHDVVITNSKDTKILGINIKLEQSHEKCINCTELSLNSSHEVYTNV